MNKPFVWCTLLLGALLLTGCTKTIYEQDDFRAVSSTSDGVTTLDIYLNLAGAELSETARENLESLPAATEEPVTLSDGNSYDMQATEPDDNWHTELFQSYDQLEDLLDVTLRKSAEVQYPEGKDHFYLQYNDREKLVDITCAQVEQDGMTVSASMFCYLDTPGKQYITGGMEISDAIVHEVYQPVADKQVHIFADDDMQTAKILILENNILYEWELTCGMQGAKQFVDTIVWTVPETTKTVTRG